MKKLVVLLALSLVSQFSHAASGDGVQINDTDINLSTYDGSLTVVLDVGDTFTYKLINDGVTALAQDVVIDLGQITAGASSITDGAACPSLTGLNMAGLSQGAVAATCQGRVDGSGNKSIRLQLPMQAQLTKAGSGPVNVTYTRNSVAAFQSFSLRDTRSLNDFASPVGTDLLLGGAVAMNDGDALNYDLEIEAVVSGPATLAHYEDVIQIDIQP